MERGIEFADLLGIVSLYLGVRNLTENEQQSAVPENPPPE